VDDAALRRSLLAWYRREARDLPWRRTADPYAIWVSEIMLQQTRVDVAKPYFQRWMARFPTVHALAAAKEEAVLQAWSGLGYYRRARNLHAAARRIAADGMPSDAASLRELPGVGAYTAGAIASIAFGERVPAVDGNVVRVLARLHAWTGSASSPRLTKQVQAAAERLVPARGAGDWNQALMDLGATVCTPKAPRCDSCPVARLCKAKAGKAGSRRRRAGPRRAPSAATTPWRAAGTRCCSSATHRAACSPACGCSRAALPTRTFPSSSSGRPGTASCRQAQASRPATSSRTGRGRWPCTK
jgi:A/G-specific adenine glycosylase